MSVRNIASTVLVAAALFATQSASAGEIGFFKNQSETAASEAKANGAPAARISTQEARPFSTAEEI